MHSETLDPKNQKVSLVFKTRFISVTWIDNIGFSDRRLQRVSIALFTDTHHLEFTH